MADVYLAHDVRHNRKVAIKVMHRELAQRPRIIVVLNWFEELRAKVPR